MIRPEIMERVALVVGVALLAGCPASSSESTDAKVYDFTKASVSDRKALVYNLIGRWYPVAEINRLDDDSMTPEDWCAREPARLEIFLDDVNIWCENKTKYSSPIARVDRSKEGGILLVLRAQKDAKFKQLTFMEIISDDREKNRPRAQVFGTPCTDDPSKAVAYARFPRLEILERQILDGRHCAQVPPK